MAAAPKLAYHWHMDDHAPAPNDMAPTLQEDLAASDADLAAGRAVSGEGLKRRIDQAIARMARRGPDASVQ